MSESRMHPLVVQLCFTRGKFLACMEGISDEEARKRFLPMNCLGWIMGHLANQEHRYWVQAAQGKTLAPGLDDLVGHGKPASTPSLEEMKQVWKTITGAADDYLDMLTSEMLQSHMEQQGKPMPESIGTMLHRNIYHYWYHIGEACAIRQLLGHTNIPEYVGDLSLGVYEPE